MPTKPYRYRQSAPLDLSVEERVAVERQDGVRRPASCERPGEEQRGRALRQVHLQVDEQLPPRRVVRRVDVGRLGLKMDDWGRDLKEIGAKYIIPLRR